MDDWLRRLLEKQFGPVPANILLVIAGRNPLDQKNWSPFLGLLTHLSLKPFSKEEAIQYLSRKSITDNDIIEVILHLSSRLPILVAMLANKSPDAPANVGDPCSEAVEQFLKWVETPIKRQLALDVALPQYFNRDIVAVLVGNDDADELFNWLQKEPFVEKKSGIGWVYHEVVRTQMLRYRRDEAPQGWSDLHKKLAEYYENLRDNLRLDEKKGREDETWQRFNLQVLYHRLCQAPEANLGIALRNFVSNFKVPCFAFLKYYVLIVYYAGVDVENDVLKNWAIVLNEGLNDYGERRYERTIQMFTSLLREADLGKYGRATALDWRGHLYSLVGETSKALEDLNKAIELAPNEAEYWVDRGLAYQLNNSYDNAITDLNQAIKLAPDYTWALRIRASTYSRNGQFNIALFDCKRIIELEPNNIQAIVQHGEILWQMSQPYKALDDLNYALKQYSQNTHALLIRGEILWQIGQYDEALEDFNKAVELVPNYTQAIISRGETNRQMGRYEEALADFNLAIELVPNNTRAIALRGETFQRVGRYQDALADFNQVLNQVPDDFWAIVHRGITYRQMGFYIEALNDFDRTIELKPKCDWCFYYRAIAYGILGKMDEVRADFKLAIQYAQEAYGKGPKNWRNTFNLAVYYLAYGESDKADHLYKEAITGGASQYIVREAIHDLEDVLSIFPDHFQAQAMRDLLQQHLREAKT